jgi:membrane-bound ClpP family serine protease
METGGVIGIIYGIILLILGGLGLYSLDYLNNIYTAYFLIILGILAIIAGACFGRKK